MTKSKHIPKRRFKEFELDGEWEQEKLGEISNITAGGDVVKEKLLIKGNYPVLANAHTNEGVIGYYEEDYQVEAPAVTVTGRGDIGFAKARKENFTPVVRLLSVKSEHNVDFLAEAINQNNVVFESTGVPQLTIPKLSNYKVYFPSTIGEENSIGNFLVSFDSLIALHQHKLDKLKNLKKSYLAELFPVEGERVPKRRFPGFEGDWERKKVSELFKITRGYVLAATRTESNKSKTTPYPVYSSQTKDKGLMGFYSKYLYEDAITWTTDGANAGEVNFREGKFYCTNVCGVLLSKEVQADPMIAEAINNIAKKYVSYVGNPKLMNNVMADIEISIPQTSSEREKISQFFTDIDKRISHQQEKLDKLKDLKKAYLNELFV